MKLNILCIVIFAFFLNCSKNADTNTSTSTFNCKIDGQYFEDNTAAAIIENQISDGLIQIFATKNDRSVELIFDEKVATPGSTSELEGGVSIAGKSYIIDGEKKGMIKITSRSESNISGTFSFEAVDDLITVTKKVQVSEGNFNVAIGK